MLTNKFKREILDYVTDIIGTNATGLYINAEAIEGTLDPDDDCIFSNVAENFAIAYDDLPYFCGASKFVIEYGNYVIKIPFTGFYNWETEEEVKPILAGYWNEKNPCEMEIDIYNNATDELKEILLPTIWVGNINNLVPIYIQRKIDVKYNGYLSNHRISNNNERLGNKVRKLNYDFSAIGTTGVYGLICKFGINLTRFLLNEIDESISDLHTGNYGYIEDNLVIFDYAGYDIFNWTYI